MLVSCTLTEPFSVYDYFTNKKDCEYPFDFQYIGTDEDTDCYLLYGKRVRLYKTHNEKHFSASLLKESDRFPFTSWDSERNIKMCLAIRKPLKSFIPTTYIIPETATEGYTVISGRYLHLLRQLRNIFIQSNSIYTLYSLYKLRTDFPEVEELIKEIKKEENFEAVRSLFFSKQQKP